MQTQQLLVSRAIFLAGGALYLALLAAWAPLGILSDIFSAFQSSSGFPEACRVGEATLQPPCGQMSNASNLRAGVQDRLAFCQG